MKSGRKRIQQMFFLLSNSNGFLRSKELADYTMLSERTVKNEINNLKNFALNNGCKLISKRGYGYKLEIVDEKIYEETKMQLSIRYANSDFFKREEMSWADIIIRNLMVLDDYIKIDDLAGKLNISRSAMKYELKEVRRFLDTFNLSLETKPGYGIKVLGDELSRRLCMLEMYEFHFHMAVSHISNSEFLANFECDENERRAIRQTMLKVLRGSGYRLIDTLSQRLFRYLVLLRNRYKQGRHIMLESKYKDELAQYREYSVAQRAFAELQSFGGFEVDENEVYALTLMLLIWTDLYEKDNLALYYKNVYKEAEGLLNAALPEVEKDWNVSLAALPNYRDVFMAIFVPIAIWIKFSPVIRYNLKDSVTEENFIRTSPLSMAFSSSIYKYLAETIGFRLTGWQMNMLAVRFFTIINKIEYNYSPPKIIVSSRNGIQAAGMIREKIIKHFGKEYFRAIDVYNFYEVRPLENEDYDYVILNYSNYSYSYSIPFLCVDLMPAKEEFNSIYSNIILGAYKFDELLDSFGFSGNYVYDDYEFESKDSFIGLIAFKYGKDYAHTQALQKELMEMPDLYIFGATAIIVVNDEHTANNYLGIFKFRRLAEWNKREIKYFIFVSVSFKNLYQVRFIENLTHELANYQGNIEKLIKDKTLPALVDLVKESVGRW